MRLTFFIQNLGKGGAQKHTIDLAQATASSHTATIVVQENVQTPNAAGVRVERCLPVRTGPLRVFRKALHEARTIAETRPDMVICINQTAAIVGIFGRILGRYRCPVVVIFHSTKIATVGAWLRTIPFILLSPLIDDLVYVSRNQARAWKHILHPRRMEVIVNGIDAKLVNPRPGASHLRRTLGLEGQFVIGSVAMFRPEKNHAQQLRALKALRDLGVVCKLLLVGGGPLLEATQRLAHELGVFEFVVFAGEQTDVPEFIQLMDVGVNTSTSIETLSLAALECMALGVPMIMSDVGGASEIISHGVDGFVYKPGDDTALVSFVERLARADAERRSFGMAAAQKVRSVFDRRDMVRRYLDLFTRKAAAS